MRVAVIGAGIVGLHVASALRALGHEVFVLEREARASEHTSGRNSGVVHSGIYYTPGSLKETLCVEGNPQTYTWLERLQVPHRRCGKLVLPDAGDHAALEAFEAKVAALPIPRARRVSRADVRALEPAVAGDDGLFVPSTGVMDAAAYVTAMRTFCRNEGVEVLLRCAVTGVDTAAGTLETTRGPLPFDVAVNCAGLYADDVATLAGLTGYAITPFRGDYYVLPQAGWLGRPVYHIARPGDPGLGVHLTPTTDDHVLLGPNVVEGVPRDDYRHRSPPDAFVESLRHMLPDADPALLQPAWSGNRPKLTFQGARVPDFVIRRHGAWIHTLGIESPGLTAAPAIAARVCALL